MPVRQLFAPASIPGLAHDHSYMEVLIEDDFLRREGLTAVTAEHAANIEMQTRGQTSSTMWFEERCKIFEADCISLWGNLQEHRQKGQACIS